MIPKDKAFAIIKSEYARLDEITGVDTSRVLVKLSTRMSRRLGCFEVKSRGIFLRPELTIKISDKILDRDELFYDVIRHEYAHACVYLRDPRRAHGHDAMWKAVCREVGCRPRATVKAEQ